MIQNLDLICKMKIKQRNFICGLLPYGYGFSISDNKSAIISAKIKVNAGFPRSGISGIFSGQ
jgi:hypothetical protein